MKPAPRLLLTLVFALAPPPARALGLVFESAATTASDTCADPCFQIRIFLEDPTRDVEVQAIQLDVDISGGGTPAVLPIPGQFSNENGAGGNFTIQDGEGNVFALPWDLTTNVGRSPAVGFDALAVSAGAEPFDVKTLAAVLAAQTCVGANCAIVGAGLAANRIYLGRFNATLDGAPVFLRVDGITGVGPGVENPVYGVGRLNGSACSFAGGICRIDVGVRGVSEPAGALLVAAALVLLAGVRRRPPTLPLIAALLVAAGAANADPPLLIQYQGILLQPDGSPRVGPVDLELALFDAPLEGNALYRERHPAVPLVDGAFTVALGGGQERVPDGLSPALFAGPGTRWLQVSVDGEVLAPRQQFLSVPYALESASAVSLQGQSLSQVVEAPSPIAGYEQLSASAAFGAADASCPPGKVAVGGGCECAGATTESRPVGGYNAWHCECSSPSSANRAWVLCAASGGDVCGNGVREGVEVCDSASGAACPDGRCGAGCVCACGNGVLESPEQCDGASALACTNGACGTDCRCTCGNGALDAGEQCDGAASQACGGAACRASCVCAVCGDGIVDAGEECDGAAASACSNGRCGSSCLCTCGNGVLDPGEACDGDATQLCPADSSGCSASCGCLRCGDGICAAPETATSCAQDCARSYRSCSSDAQCDLGLYCRSGVCTDSCSGSCDIDPVYDEVCSSASAIGYCIALCRLDESTSTWVCPSDLVCSDPVNGGNCIRRPAL